jgi:hypothetical protein
MQMEIVIKISDTLMEYIIQGRDLSEEQNDEMACAIVDGTPLPKGHGDLIDRSEVIVSLFDYCKGKKTIGQCIDDVQTIIEADKESDSE